MNLLQFIRLILHNVLLLVLIPLFAAGIIFFILKDQQKEYSSETKIYTGFASGYSIGEDHAKDFFSTKTQFANLFETLKSRKTKKEISLKAMSYYLAQERISEVDMSRKNQQIFFSFFTNERKKMMGITKDEEKNFEQLLTLCNENNKNEIYNLLNAKPENNHPLGKLFSIGKLKTSLNVYQESSSDLVTISCTASDAGICFKILETAVDVVLENVKLIKSIESNDVVKYYEKATKDAKDRLDMAEDELSEFMNSNRVINYYEETKLIAARKENFEQNRQDEKLFLVSEEARFEDLQNELSEKDRQKLTNGKVLALRGELTSIKSNIAVMEIQKASQFGADNDNENLTAEDIEKKEEITAKILELKNQAIAIETKLRAQVSELFRANPITSGNSRKDVAITWLENILNIEESKARLKQYTIFSREFDRTYSRFSKLGSKTKRFERKISVIEREYLEMLSALNDAKMRQKSIEMSGDMKIIDTPYYPTSPEKSKLKLMMIIGAVAIFLILLTIIVLLNYFDKSIRTFERYKVYTGTEILGGFSVIHTKKSSPSEALKVGLIRQMINSLQLFYLNATLSENRPNLVLFCSTRNQEGKTQLSRLIADGLRGIGKKVRVLNSSTVEHQQWPLTEEHPDNGMEVLKDGILNSAKIQDIVRQEKEYDFIFIEIPSLIANRLPIDLIQQADFTCLVSKANRTWGAADTLAVRDYKGIVNTPIRCILNGVDDYDLEAIIGEIPRKRSKLRTKMKEVVTFKFKRNRF